jgi:hypothetical protein
MAALFIRLFSRYASRFALLAPLLLCVPHTAVAARWREPVEVIYADAGSPVPRDAAEAAIRYALASWSARIDLPLRWSNGAAGTTYTAGSIVIRWLDVADSLNSANNLLSLASTRRWVYSSSGTIAAAEIQLRRAAFLNRENDACFTHVVLHELGHALGIGHVPAPNAVMNKELTSCHHALTEADISAAPYPQHVCHAELLPDFSIYIPVIRIGARSFASLLRYEAGTWSVAEYMEVPPHPECDDTWLRDGNLMLAKLWTAAHTWQGELQSAGPYRWSLKPDADIAMPTK